MLSQSDEEHKRGSWAHKGALKMPLLSHQTILISPHPTQGQGSPRATIGLESELMTS